MKYGERFVVGDVAWQIHTSVDKEDKEIFIAQGYLEDKHFVLLRYPSLRDVVWYRRARRVESAVAELCQFMQWRMTQIGSEDYFR